MFQHSAAVAAGFRNSGLSVSRHGKIIAVCCSSLLSTVVEITELAELILERY